MPGESVLTRVARFLGIRRTATQDLSTTLPFALPASHLEARAKVDRAMEMLRGNENSTLRGPGANRVRAAQAIIRRLARRAPPTGGIRAGVAMRSAVISNAAGRQVAVRAPALVSSDPHLRAPQRAASEIHPDLRRLVAMADTARRRREEIRSLLDRVASGNASAEERTRLRHLARAASALIATADFERRADAVVEEEDQS